MGNTTAITRTLIKNIKQSLFNGSYKWNDTGKKISYNELLDVLNVKEPLTYEQANGVLLSLGNDERITKI